MSNYPRLLNAQEMESVVAQILPQVPKEQRNGYLAAIALLRQANDISDLDSGTFETFTVNNPQEALFAMVRRSLSINMAYSMGDIDEPRARALAEALGKRVTAPLQQAMNGGADPFPLTIDLSDV